MNYDDFIRLDDEVRQISQATEESAVEGSQTVVRQIQGFQGDKVVEDAGLQRGQTVVGQVKEREFIEPVEGARLDADQFAIAQVD